MYNPIRYSVLYNDTKYVTHLRKFTLPNKDQQEKDVSDGDSYCTYDPEEPIPESDTVERDLIAFSSSGVNPVQPRIALWDFMEENKLEEFMKVQNKLEIKKILASLVPDYLKGKGKEIFIALMYNVRKFCDERQYSLKPSGAVLSQFYLTHQYFTHTVNMNADKVYNYFKELTICHSLPFIPTHMKVFTQFQSKEIMLLFCKIYLRNLPLIRFLTLPSYALQMTYEILPDPPILKKKRKDKDGKTKKKGKDKKSSKGSKKGK